MAARLSTPIACLIADLEHPAYFAQRDRGGCTAVSSSLLEGDRTFAHTCISNWRDRQHRLGVRQGAGYCWPSGLRALPFGR
jgi:hypothetical protein